MHDKNCSRPSEAILKWCLLGSCHSLGGMMNLDQSVECEKSAWTSWETCGILCASPCWGALCPKILPWTHAMSLSAESSWWDLTKDDPDVGAYTCHDLGSIRSMEHITMVSPCSVPLMRPFSSGAHWCNELVPRRRLRRSCGSWSVLTREIRSNAFFLLTLTQYKEFATGRGWVSCMKLFRICGLKSNAAHSTLSS